VVFKNVDLYASIWTLCPSEFVFGGAFLAINSASEDSYPALFCQLPAVIADTRVPRCVLNLGLCALEDGALSQTWVVSIWQNAVVWNVDDETNWLFGLSWLFNVLFLVRRVNRIFVLFFKFF